jgi:hypothetical protein
MKKRTKFLLATKTSLKYVKEELDLVYDKIKDFEHYDEQYELHGLTTKIKWEYSDPEKTDKKIIEKPAYLHIYYNIEKATEEKKAFYKRLARMQKEILAGELKPNHESVCKKFFEVKSTPKRGIQVKVNEIAVEEATRYYGYFALLSNFKMDSTKALEVYRNKDLAEKAFGNLYQIQKHISKT